MDLQERLRDTIIQELRRQADNSDGKLKLDVQDERVTIDGPINLDELIMVVAGSLAGGP